MYTKFRQFHTNIVVSGLKDGKEVRDRDDNIILYLKDLAY